MLGIGVPVSAQPQHTLPLSLNVNFLTGKESTTLSTSPGLLRGLMEIRHGMPLVRAFVWL